MNPEDIKIGERVSLSGYIANKTDKHFYITIHTGFNEYTKIKVEIPSLELFEIMPENGIKNTETAPKYDPCRKFRKGDIVTPKVINGRFFDKFTKEFVGLKCEVLQDEEEFEYVIIRANDERSAIDAAYLELVTPVEEQEPYSIGKSDYNGFVNIEKKRKIIAMIPYGKELHEHKTEEEALAAAQAECDRLNAEYRKEMGK